MKRHLPLLLTLAFALLAVCSCQHRKSAEEGERFLQESRRKMTRQSDSTAYWKQQLFEAEQNYDFTPEQRIRLKIAQLSHLSTSDSLQEKQITETEALAIQLGNDSLLQEVRWTVFKRYSLQNDSENALRLFRGQEATLLARSDSAKLNLYYVGLIMLYDRIYQADSAAYWHLRTRSMNQRRLASWYGRMSAFLFNAGRNDEALLYADSCLNYRPINISTRLAKAYPVKGRILSTRGQIAEAMHLYAAALNEIEEFRREIAKPSVPPIVGFSPSERVIIYQYAELLYQNGRIPEAITQLQRLLAVSNRYDRLLKNGLDLYSMRYKRGDHFFPQFLLAQCYQALGQTAKAIHYTHIGDSLQNAYTAYLWQQRNEAEKTQSSNQYLTTRLLVKEQEAKNARLTQVILWSTVALLLIVIASGLVWWRNHRRRLQQLFGMLIRHHAEWQSMHTLLPVETCTADLLVLAPGLPTPAPEACTAQAPEAPAPDVPNTPPCDASTLANRRLYHRTLRVMKDKQPFLDPTLDLVTLARLAGSNRTQLSIAINQQANTTFSNWLAEYRVNHLIECLNKQPDCYPNELYPQAGFSSRTSFYRQFRQITGLTPRQYMNQRSE